VKACDLSYEWLDLEPVSENFKDRNLGVVRPKEMNGNLWILRPVADVSGEDVPRDAFPHVEVVTCRVSSDQSLLENDPFGVS